MYKPHLVRFGRGQGKHVKPVSLDNLVENVKNLRPEQVHFPHFWAVLDVLKWISCYKQWIPGAHRATEVERCGPAAPGNRSFADLSSTGMCSTDLLTALLLLSSWRLTATACGCIHYGRLCRSQWSYPVTGRRDLMKPIRGERCPFTS